MSGKRELINWMAGITTLVAALLIVIVLLEPRENGVSMAVASKTVALTLASGTEISENGPEESFFSPELQDEWYVKYMDYLYGRGILDANQVPPEEKDALSSVTYGDLAAFSASVPAGEESGISAYRDGGKRPDAVVSPENFWEFYDVFRAAADGEGKVTELSTDLYGTPDNVEAAAPWTAYTKDGRFRFEGLSLDSCIDKTVRLLVRDGEILKVEEVVSDEIVYENAWISGISGKAVTVFIGNIKREFPIRGVLRNEEEISGQIGDLYLKGGKPKRLVLKKEKITGTVLAVRDTELEIEGYGPVPLSSGFKIYRTYGVLREQQKKDILVGYHAQEFVVADGEICAALTTEKPQIDNIRVLLMTTNFQSLFHEEIRLSCDTMAVLESGDEKNRKTESVAAGETVSIRKDDSRLKSGRLVFRPANEGGMITVQNLERAQGTPVYPGEMELTADGEGLLLVP